jgi:hypothetical protein
MKLEGKEVCNFHSYANDYNELKNSIEMNKFYEYFLKAGKNQLAE